MPLRFVGKGKGAGVHVIIVTNRAVNYQEISPVIFPGELYYKWQHDIITMRGEKSIL